MKLFARFQFLKAWNRRDAVKVACNPPTARAVILSIALLWLLVAESPMRAADSGVNLIQNGSFETGPAIPAGPKDLVQLSAGNPSLAAWTIVAGTIDYVGTYYRASDGSKSIDLSGHSAGEIRQAFATVPGLKYRLTFDLAGEPFGVAPSTKHLHASILGANQEALAGQAFAFDTTQGTTRANMGWAGMVMEFTADSTSATLAFRSLDEGSSGPALDNVSVVVLESGQPFISIQSPTYMQTVLDSKPVSYWRLGENKGKVAGDVLGNNHGAIIGTPLKGMAGALTNATNGCFAFNGVSDYLEIPYSDSLNGAAFSVELWAKVTGGMGTYRSALTSRDDVHKGYIIYAGAGNTWEFWIGDDSPGPDWRAIYGPQVIPDAWTHLVGVYDGAHQSFYVNGQLIGRVANRFVRNSTNPLRIGAGDTESPTPSFHFKGLMDEVAVYDKPLAVSEVMDHYQTGSSGVTKFQGLPDLGIYAGLAITAEPGTRVAVDYSTDLTNWFQGISDTLQTRSLMVLDLKQPLGAKRFYRVRR